MTIGTRSKPAHILTSFSRRWLIAVTTLGVVVCLLAVPLVAGVTLAPESATSGAFAAFAAIAPAAQAPSIAGITSPIVSAWAIGSPGGLTELAVSRDRIAVAGARRPGQAGGAIPQQAASPPASMSTMESFGETGTLTINKGLAETRHTKVLVNSNVAGASLMRVMPSEWATISADWARVAGIQRDGSVWAWGSAPVGDGSTFGSYAPVRLMAGSTFKDVQVGNTFTVALRTDGTLWAWGKNDYGQLGIGNTTQMNTPVQVGNPATRWVKFSVGSNHVLAIATDGKVYGWGWNGWGQMGNGFTSPNYTSPTQVAAAVPGPYADVWATYYSSFVRCSNGDVWGWGKNDNGELGLGGAWNQRSPAKLPQQWTQLRAGNAHALGLRSDGSLWSWGRNTNGQMGLEGQPTTYTPQMVSDGSGNPWVQVCAGTSVSGGRRADGTVLGWGNGYTTTPAQVLPGASAPGTATTVAMTAETWGAVTQAGDLYMWGSGIYGQMADGTNASRTEPAPSGFSAYAATFTLDVPAGDGLKTLNVEYRSAAGSTTVLSDSITLRTTPADSLVLDGGAATTSDATVSAGLSAIGVSSMRVGPKVRAVDAGMTFTSVLFENGPAIGGGEDDAYLMGDGSNTGALYFRTMASGRPWHAIALGDYHALAIAPDRSLWAWGNNNSGQMGDGTWTHRSTPVLVDRTKRWRSVAAGLAFSVAVAEDGAMWAWGDNSYGQIRYPSGRTGGTWAFWTPQVIPGSWVSASAGDYALAAIRSDGTMWTAGESTNGQLGNGSVSVQTTMTQVPGTWSQVSMGTGHGLGIKTDGTLWGWGDNTKYQLGDLTSTDRLSPVPIDGSMWSSVTAGKIASGGIKNDGSMWTWGSNDYFQQNSGSTGAYKLVPTVVGQADATLQSLWTSIDMGEYHAVAIKKDGSVWTWGTGTSGQMGIDFKLLGPMYPAYRSWGSPVELAFGMPPVVPYATATETVLRTVTGTSTVSAAFIDPAGNVSLATDDIVRIGPPSTSFHTRDGFSESEVATFTLRVTDSYGPVAATYYKVGAGPVATYQSVPVTVTSQGATTVAYWSVDANGNSEATKTASVRIDRHTSKFQSAPSACVDCHPTYPTAHPSDDCYACHQKPGFGEIEGPVTYAGHGFDQDDDPYWCHVCHPHVNPPEPIVWVNGGIPDHYMDLVEMQDCAQCHSGQFPWMPRHTADRDIEHLTTQPMDGRECGLCHSATLDREHYSGTKTTTCLTCHGAAARAGVSEAIAAERTDCVACHPANVGHSEMHTSTVGPTCQSCHQGNLVTEHLDVRGLDCATCHGATARIEASAAIAANDTSCPACHVGGHPHPADGLTGVQANGERLCLDCHAADLVDEHMKPTSSSSAAACDACHLAGGPRESVPAWGGTCSEGECHQDGGTHEVHSTYCVGCHGTSRDTTFAVNKVEFSAPKVDPAACRTCHWISMNDGVFSSFTHGHADGVAPRNGPNCGKCHPAWMGGWSADLTKLPVQGTEHGFFADSPSASATAPTIHDVHVNGSWPKDLNPGPDYPNSCRSCHGPAGCGTCHADPDADTHVQHTRDLDTLAYPADQGPFTYHTAAGTGQGRGDQVNFPETVSTCANDNCHSLSKAGDVAAFEPACSSCHPDRVSPHGP